MTPETSTNSPLVKPRRNRMLLAALALLAFAVVAVAASLVLQVDNWQRDLAINVAETSESATDPRLRPLDVELPPADAAAMVRKATLELPRWQAGDIQSDGEIQRLELVRTTPLMRYRDDVRVSVISRDGGARIHVHSQSRVGRGDLGQNPRNIDELLSAVRRHLVEGN